jgi:hypothetical protein
VADDPTKWDNVIIKGIPHSSLIELESSRIREIVALTELSRIIDKEYLTRLDFSVQQFKAKGLFCRTRMKEVETIFYVHDPTLLINLENYKNNFIEVMFENSDRKKFLNVNNFNFSRDGTKIATVDFRVLVDDLSGKVSKEELLHIASIASMMLTGIIEYPIGYSYIIDFMKKHGYTEFTFQENGYLHIKLNPVKPFDWIWPPGILPKK